MSLPPRMPPATPVVPSCSTSTTPTTPPAPMIRAGLVRWHRARIGLPCRCAPASGSFTRPDGVGTGCVGPPSCFDVRRHSVAERPILAFVRRDDDLHVLGPDA